MPNTQTPQDDADHLIAAVSKYQEMSAAFNDFLRTHHRRLEISLASGSLKMENLQAAGRVLTSLEGAEFMSMTVFTEMLRMYDIDDVYIGYMALSFGIAPSSETSSQY